MVALTDRYTLQARVLPVAVACLPAAAVGSAWFPLPDQWWRLAGSTGAAAVLGVLLGEPARSAGQDLQARLWAQWGGPPTIRMLRHRDGSIDPGTKARIHGRLVGLGVVPAMPSAAEEEARSAEADAVYESCSTWLRNRALQLRAKPPFDVVHSENIAYGFARNILAIKPWALAILAASALAWAAAWWSGRQPMPALALELACLAGAAAYQARWVAESAVRKASDNYSARLLGAVDAIPLPPSKPAKRPKTAISRKTARPNAGEAR